MKKTDVAMIILIATVSVMVAFFATRAVLGTPSQETVKVKSIDRIDETITPPDAAIFNKDAINPAIKVELNNGSAAASEPTPPASDTTTPTGDAATQTGNGTGTESTGSGPTGDGS